MAGRAGADFGSLHCPHKEKTGCRRPGGGVYQRRQCRGPSKGEIGIVVRPADQTGNVLVQVKREKRLVNQKRLKLKVRASELYPEDYDFSIVFDSVGEPQSQTSDGAKICGKHGGAGGRIAGPTPRWRMTPCTQWASSFYIS